MIWIWDYEQLNDAQHRSIKVGANIVVSPATNAQG